MRLVDFGAEVRDAQRALREVERATDRKDGEVRAAVERWEAAVVRAVDLADERASLTEIAAELGCHRVSVRKAVTAAGLPLTGRTYVRRYPPGLVTRVGCGSDTSTTLPRSR